MFITLKSCALNFVLKDRREEKREDGYTLLYTLLMANDHSYALKYFVFCSFELMTKTVNI